MSTSIPSGYNWVMRLRLVLLALVAITAIGGIAFGLLNYSGLTSGEPQKNLETVNETGLVQGEDTTGESGITQNTDFELMGWLPDWAGVKGVESVRQNGAALDVLSPVWYEINTDGSLRSKVPSNSGEILILAAENNLHVVPTIANFDFSKFAESVETEEKLQRQIDEIVAVVIENNYDGIDLDYESIEISEQDEFLRLVDGVSAGLRPQGKRVSLTLLSQWDEQGLSYKSFRQTRQVQDWEQLAPLVDEIRIMAYDYTSPLAVNPGPIAPEDWVRDVLDYAVERIPREKIVLAVHLYSYEWYVTSADYQEALASGDPDPLRFAESSGYNLPLASNRARSYTYDTIKTILAEEEADSNSQLGNYQGEQIFRFDRINPQTQDLEERLLVYIDPAGVAERIELARDEYGIKGVSFWRLGGEEELLGQFAL